MVRKEGDDNRIIVTLALTAILIIVAASTKKPSLNPTTDKLTLFYNNSTLVLDDYADRGNAEEYAPHVSLLLLEKIRVNEADARLLETVPGIGKTLSLRIVAERESNGPYRHATDLRRVAGIGTVRSEKFMNHLRFE